MLKIGSYLIRHTLFDGGNTYIRQCSNKPIKDGAGASIVQNIKNELKEKDKDDAKEKEKLKKKEKPKVPIGASVAKAKAPMPKVIAVKEVTKKKNSATVVTKEVVSKGITAKKVAEKKVDPKQVAAKKVAPAPVPGPKKLVTKEVAPKRVATIFTAVPVSGSKKLVIDFAHFNKEVTEKDVDIKNVAVKEVDTENVAVKEVDVKEVADKKPAAEEVSAKQAAGKEVEPKNVAGKKVDAKTIAHKVVDAKTIAQKVIDAKKVADQKLAAKEVSHKQVAGKEADAKSVAGKVVDAKEVAEKEVDAKGVATKKVSNEEAAQVAGKEVDPKQVADQTVIASPDSSSKKKIAKETVNILSKLNPQVILTSSKKKQIKRKQDKSKQDKRKQDKSKPDKKSQNKKYPLLIAFGNPILDVTCKVKSAEIFHKFKLKPDHQYLKSTKEITEIRNDALKLNGGKSSINPGGSSLNTARLLGSLLKPHHRVMYCGSIGRDRNGKLLHNLLQKSDIKAKFEVISNEPTGNCLCLIWKDNACLIADVGAALHYNIEHIGKRHLDEYLKNTSFIYIEGFFIPNRVKACKYLLKEICQKHGVMYIMNLSAAYIINTFPKECQMLSENADAVFGNAEQFTALGKQYKLKNLESIMWHLLKANPNSKQKCPPLKNKLLVATDGPNPVNMFYIRDNQMCHETLAVPDIYRKKMVDTTGAGDAFLAGFLTSFLQYKKPLDCAKFGSTVAADIIQNFGVNLSKGFNK